MSGRTRIEWAQRTWNPITGCDLISDECLNCYARRHAGRLQRMGVNGYESGFELTHHADRLTEPYRWKKPSRVFVVSMGDMFHRAVADSFLRKMFTVMRENPAHTFILCTKRSEDFRELPNPPLRNVWGGVTVGNRLGLRRIDDLIEAPFAVRWVSFEPLLENIATRELLAVHPFIDWGVIGGESGLSARPCSVSWVQELRGALEDSATPTFVKQLGRDPRVERPGDFGPWPDHVKFVKAINGGGYHVKLRHPKGGDPDEWPEEMRDRRFPDDGV